MMVGLATVYSGIIWTSNCLLGLFLIRLSRFCGMLCRLEICYLFSYKLESCAPGGNCFPAATGKKLV